MSEQRDVGEDLEAVNQSRKYASERGPFAINANPAINQPYPREKVDGDLAAAVFAHEPLAEKFGEDAARRKIGEMVKAFMPGTTTTPLFDQPGPNGMSLAHEFSAVPPQPPGIGRLSLLRGCGRDCNGQAQARSRVDLLFAQWTTLQVHRRCRGCGIAGVSCRWRRQRGAWSEA